jgi:hypothetical protein
LQPGWNEVLIKLDERGGSAAFTLELLARDSGPLIGAKVQATKPGT